MAKWFVHHWESELVFPRSESIYGSFVVAVQTFWPRRLHADMNPSFQRLPDCSFSLLATVEDILARYTIIPRHQSSVFNTFWLQLAVTVIHNCSSRQMFLRGLGLCPSVRTLKVLTSGRCVFYMLLYKTSIWNIIVKTNLTFTKKWWIRPDSQEKSSIYIEILEICEYIIVKQVL